MKIYELLNKPEKWLQGADARNKFYKTVNANSSSARAWCLLGACKKCYKDSYTRHFVYDKIFGYLRKKPILWGISDWNDRPGRVWKDVYNLVSKLNI